jgi:tetratricopeptide (TPR) repeat protein
MDCLLGQIARTGRRGAFRWLGLFALCLSWASLGSPAAAQATRPTARTYLERGLKLYDEGQYDAAIRELRLGYALEPLPQFLYTLGQAERKLGRCDEALTYYRQYLPSADATSAGAVRFQIERCEQQQRDAAVRAAPREVPHGEVVVPPRRRPFYRDWIGMTLAGVGAGAALAGGGLLIGSTLELQRSRASFEQFDSTLSGAQTMRTAGIVLAAAGGAVLIAGVIRLSLVSRARAPASGGR